MTRQPRTVPFARPALGEEEIAEVAATLRSGWIALGPKTREFEAAFAQYIGVPEAVALSSGTAGLHLALLALGIGPGDEVILPTYTFVSAALSVLHVGATPVLVDVEPRALTISPEAIANAITTRTRAVMPVHLGGTACDMDPIMEIAKQNRLLVIEDAAHALPTEYRGRRVGTIGDVTVFSFYATKTLATGDGGMLVARDSEVLKRVRTLSLHGMDADAWRRYDMGGSWRYDVTAAGFKYNFTDIGAAIGLHQLRKLEPHAARRTAIAESFHKSLDRLPGLTLPETTPGATHAWHLFAIRFDPTQCGFTRDLAHEHLRKAGIGTSVHFIPVHQFTLFRAMAAEQSFPVSDAAFERSLSLPIYPGLSDEDVRYVISNVRDLWRD